MLSPRHARLSFTTFVCACLLAAGTRGGVVRAQEAQAQTPAQSAETARGVALYKQGDFKAAVDSLKKASRQDAADADAWQYLALALKQTGDEKSAQRAMERAVYLRHARLSSFSVSNRPYSALSKEERAVFRAEQARRYAAALETVNAYLQFEPQDAAFWREQAESLNFYIAQAENPAQDDAIYAGDEVTARAVILSKPLPTYTEEARQHQISGRILVRLVLAPDETVQHVLVTRPLPYGLSERALEVARRIRFKPAMKDGRAVAQYVTIEYGFSIY